MAKLARIAVCLFLVSTLAACGPDDPTGNGAAAPTTEMSLTLQLSAEQIMDDEPLDARLIVDTVKVVDAVDIYVTVAWEGETHSLLPGAVLSPVERPYFFRYRPTLGIDTLPLLGAELVALPPGTTVTFSATAVVAGQSLAASVATSPAVQVTVVDRSGLDAGDADQLRDWLWLKRLSSGRPLEARFHDGGVASLEMEIDAEELLGDVPDDARPEDLSLAFLREMHGLFRLPDVEEPLQLERLEGQGSERPTTFFRQEIRGAPVYGASLKISWRYQDGGWQLLNVLGSYLPDPERVKTAATEAPLSAVATISSALGLVSPDHLNLLVPPRLWIFDPAMLAPSCPTCESVVSDPRPAWRVTYFEDGGEGPVADGFVDARSGELLYTESRSYNRDYRIWTAQNTSSSTCFAFSVARRAWFDEDGRCRNEFGCPAAASCCGNACTWWGMTCAGPDSEGWDAFDNTNVIWDFWRQNFNRKSYDGHDANVRVYTHVGNNWNNASSTDCGLYDILSFGDGWGVLDIMGHEFGHSVHDHETSFVYSNESGAVAEHIADAFGHFVGYWSGQDPDWLMGEDMGSIVRNLEDPPATGQPDHYQNYNNMNGDDHGGVHHNCSIMSKALSLFTQGGQHNGYSISPIGEYKARKIYYRAVTHELCSNTGLYHLAQGVRQACEALTTVASAHDCCQVRNAFASVGLQVADVDCDGVTNTADTDDDNDGVSDALDNCPNHINPAQPDRDGDGLGDNCDPDIDGDGVNNGDDNCIFIANPSQADRDHDGWGDACVDADGDGFYDAEDNCRDEPNPGQENTDGDAYGDVCDYDDDQDGYFDSNDNCPLVANPLQQDGDLDGVGDACDNCVATENTDQADVDGDGLGNLCDVDMDGDGLNNDEDQCPEQYTDVPEWLDCPPAAACRPGCPLPQLQSDIHGGRLSPSLLRNQHPGAQRPWVRMELDPCMLVPCNDPMLQSHSGQVAIDLSVLYSEAPGEVLTTPIAWNVGVLDDQGRRVASGDVNVIDTVMGVEHNVRVQFDAHPRWLMRARAGKGSESGYHLVITPVIGSDQNLAAMSATTMQLSTAASIVEVPMR